MTQFIAETGYDRIEFTFATGVMSKIMEQCDLSVSGNGRTVYELGHMNIPSVIVTQNIREKAHTFSREENGFVSVGVYERGKTENRVRRELERLITDHQYRRRLQERMVPHDFICNKAKVLDRILGLLP